MNHPSCVAASAFPFLSFFRHKPFLTRLKGSGAGVEESTRVNKRCLSIISAVSDRAFIQWLTTFAFNHTPGTRNAFG
jgi:hypothetical protein